MMMLMMVVVVKQWRVDLVRRQDHRVVLVLSMQTIHVHRRQRVVVIVRCRVVVAAGWTLMQVARVLFLRVAARLRRALLHAAGIRAVMRLHVLGKVIRAHEALIAHRTSESAEWKALRMNC